MRVYLLHLRKQVLYHWFPCFLLNFVITRMGFLIQIILDFVHSLLLSSKSLFMFWRAVAEICSPGFFFHCVHLFQNKGEIVGIVFRSVLHWYINFQAIGGLLQFLSSFVSSVFFVVVWKLQKIVTFVQIPH